MGEKEGCPLLSAYRWVIGNFLEGILVKVCAISLPAVEVVGFADADQVAARAARASTDQVPAVDAGSPGAVGVEVVVRNTLVHDDDVRSRDNIFRVLEGFDLAGVHNCDECERDCDSLGEDIHCCDEESQWIKTCCRGY